MDLFREIVDIEGTKILKKVKNLRDKRIKHYL